MNVWLPIQNLRRECQPHFQTVPMRRLAARAQHEHPVRCGQRVARRRPGCQRARRGQTIRLAPTAQRNPCPGKQIGGRGSHCGRGTGRGNRRRGLGSRRRRRDGSGWLAWPLPIRNARPVSVWAGRATRQHNRQQANEKPKSCAPVPGRGGHAGSRCFWF